MCHTTQGRTQGRVVLRIQCTAVHLWPLCAAVQGGPSRGHAHSHKLQHAGARAVRNSCLRETLPLRTQHRSLKKKMKQKKRKTVTPCRSEAASTAARRAHARRVAAPRRRLCLRCLVRRCRAAVVQTQRMLPCWRCWCCAHARAQGCPRRRCRCFHWRPRACGRDAGPRLLLNARVRAASRAACWPRRARRRARRVQSARCLPLRATPPGAGSPERGQSPARVRRCLSAVYAAVRRKR